tara:strand:- start:1450 stop:2373 length:924 start_codon:yes stop_codon:yes gene_type:complete
MDDMGYNQQIQSINQRDENVRSNNESTRQLNIKYQQDYDNKVESDKVGDDLTYGKDVVSNLFGASAVKGAVDNRNARIARDAKNALSPLGVEGTRINPSPIQTARQRLIGGGGDLPFASSQIQEETIGRSLTHPSSNAPAVEPERIGLNKSNPSLMTRAVKGVSGLDEETAETIGKVGSAITNAGLGALSLYDGLDNVVNNKKFFDKSASTADDVNSITSMIAGASDVVGLVPGLEWVAGVGNAVGGVGGVVKMFGDHDAFKGQKKGESKILDNIQTLAPTPLDSGSQIADIGGSSSTLMKGTSAVY